MLHFLVSVLQLWASGSHLSHQHLFKYFLSIISQCYLGHSSPVLQHSGGFWTLPCRHSCSFHPYTSNPKFVPRTSVDFCSCFVLLTSLVVYILLRLGSEVLLTRPVRCVEALVPSAAMFRGKRLDLKGSALIHRWSLNLMA